MIKVIQGKVHNLLRGLSTGNIPSTKTDPYFHPHPPKETPIQRQRIKYFNAYHESNKDEFILKRTHHFLFARSYDTMHANISSTYYKEKL